MIEKLIHLDRQPLVGNNQTFRNPAGQLIQQNLGVTVHSPDGHDDRHTWAHCIQFCMLLEMWNKRFLC